MGFKKIDEPKTKRFYVRLSDAEKNTVREKAEQCDMTMSNYVRDNALNRRIVPRTDMTMLNELRRQGGSLRERLNSKELDNHPEMAREVLAAYRDIIRVIDKAIP